MPKVNATQLPERIQKRIDELEAGVEVDAKDIRAVLTAEQQTQLDAAWAEQQQLRKAKRATTAAQQQALGWRSKSEVRLEVLRQAKDKATGNIVKTFDEELRQAGDMSRPDLSEILFDPFVDHVVVSLTRG